MTPPTADKYPCGHPRTAEYNEIGNYRAKCREIDNCETLQEAKDIAEFYLKQAFGLAEEREDIKERAQAMTAMLRRVSNIQCPVCYQYNHHDGSRSHKPDCALAALLTGDTQK